jgi:hypothetical protein
MTRSPWATSKSSMPGRLVSRTTKSGARSGASRSVSMPMSSNACHVPRSVAVISSGSLAIWQERRQRKPEDRAAARRAAQPDPALVGLDDGLADVQPSPGAEMRCGEPLGAVAAALASPETAERIAILEAATSGGMSALEAARLSMQLGGLDLSLLDGLLDLSQGAGTEGGGQGAPVPLALPALSRRRS